MAELKDVSVVINGRVYRLSGYENEEYIQSIATYLNVKLSECQSSEPFRRLTKEDQNMLMAINIADDYFKARKRAEQLEAEDSNKEKIIYDLRQEKITTQIQNESVNKLVEEYKEQISSLQRKIIRLEAKKNSNE